MFDGKEGTGCGNAIGTPQIQKPNLLSGWALPELPSNSAFRVSAPTPSGCIISERTHAPTSPLPRNSPTSRSNAPTLPPLPAPTFFDEDRSPRNTPTGFYISAQWLRRSCALRRYPGSACPKVPQPWIRHISSRTFAKPLGPVPPLSTLRARPVRLSYRTGCRRRVDISTPDRKRSNRLRRACSPIFVPFKRQGGVLRSCCPFGMTLAPLG